MRTAASLALLALFAIVSWQDQTARADEPSAAAGEAMTFRIAYGNLQLAEARVWINERDGRYEVGGEGGTNGPLDWLFDWKGSARTEGLLDNGVLLPLRHRQQGVWKGEQRTAELRYGTDRSVVHVVAPPPDPEEVTDVPAQSIPGTMDPFTAALAALKQFAETGECRGTLPIFDGRRRYDMLLEDAGQTVLQSDRPWDYAGLAHGCRLTSRRIGGFYKDNEEAKDYRASNRLVWLAELAPGTWRPVRIEVDAPIGKFVGRAVMARD